MEKLTKYNDIYNFVDKMHNNESTRSYLKSVLEHTNKPLYYWLERGYQTCMSSTLGVPKLDGHKTQEKLLRRSQELFGSGRT